MLRWDLAGGLLGAMTAAGVPEEQAHAYAEGVRRGGTLVAVTTDAILGSAAYDLMQRHGVVDIDVPAPSGDAAAGSASTPTPRRRQIRDSLGIERPLGFRIAQ